MLASAQGSMKTELRMSKTPLRFYVSFVGSTDGEWIEAASMKSAKIIFASKRGVRMSSYVVASRSSR